MQITAPILNITQNPPKHIQMGVVATTFGTWFGMKVQLSAVISFLGQVLTNAGRRSHVCHTHVQSVTLVCKEGRLTLEIY